MLRGYLAAGTSVPAETVQMSTDGTKKFKLALDYKTFDQCSVTSPKHWLVENVIALKEDSSWFGPPGAGKSALLLDLAVHVASGRDWRGHKFNRCEHCDPEEVN